MSRLVDVHSHIYPRRYVEWLKLRSTPPRVTEDSGGEFFVIFDEEEEAGPRGGRPFDRTFTDLEEKLAFMARHGISRTVVSVGNPWLDPFTGRDGLDRAMDLNDELAGYERRTDGRIVALGVLPATDVRDAVAVAVEVAKAPALHGVVIGRRVAGRLLDDPRLDPLWEVLQEQPTPVLVHPHDSVGQEQMTGFGHGLPVALGFPFETTIAVSRLVMAGVLMRFPRLRLIVSHGGGTLPYLAGRLDSGWRSDPVLRDRLPYPPSRDLRKLYLDAIVFHERALRAAGDLVGSDHLVYGTDHPFSIADPGANARALEAVYTNTDRGLVTHLTAEAIFGLAAAPHSP